VLSGEVRVLLPRGPREEQLLQVMGPGTMLGLSESMNGEKHRTRAEAADKTTIGFIPRQEFRMFLLAHGGYCIQVVESLSDELHGIYHKFRSITAHPGRPRHRLLDEQLN
jgi:CRP-like cAMP-binding protein